MKKYYNYIIILILILSIGIATASLPVIENTNQNFKIESIGYIGFGSFTQGLTTQDVPLTIINNGEQGCQYVEAGIYSRQFLTEKQYKPLSLIQNIAGICNDGELYVNTYKVCLDKGEKTKVTIKVDLPVTSLSSNQDFQTDNGYGVGVTTFTGCWGTNGKITDNGYKNIFIALGPITTKTDSTPERYCINAKQDGTESDFNCGGDCATKLGKYCKIQGKCGLDTDCSNGLQCADNSRCSVLGDSNGDGQVNDQDTNKGFWKGIKSWITKQFSAINNILSYWWIIVIIGVLILMFKFGNVTLNWVGLLIILIVTIAIISIVKPDIWDKLIPGQQGGVISWIKTRIFG
jgi:hypothetical protein